MENRRNLFKQLIQSGILLSLLFHALLLLSVSVVFILPTKKPEEQADHYIPSYVYKGTTVPPMPQFHPARAALPKQENQETSLSQSKEHQQSLPLPKSTHPNAIPIQVPEKEFEQPKKSIMDISHEILHQNQIKQAMNHLKNVEPVLLIGDKTKIVDPLILLMAKSLSAHFSYPKVEGNFGVTGRVIVEFVLHPDGTFSDVDIIQSSDNQDFDSAALYAVNTAPLVNGADKFLSAPKYFVVGFIFG